MPPKVLFVDDEPLMLLLYRNHIEKAGFQFFPARNAEEALVIAQYEQPAIIVMDVILAGLDGLGALRTLKSKAETRHIPVIIISGNTSKQHHEASKEALASGAVAFLTKPLSPPQLVTEINKFASAASPEK